MYQPHFGQTTCDGRGVPHSGQPLTCGGVTALCELRLRERDLDWRRFGTAMGSASIQSVQSSLRETRKILD